MIICPCWLAACSSVSAVTLGLPSRSPPIQEPICRNGASGAGCAPGVPLRLRVAGNTAAMSSSSSLISCGMPRRKQVR